MAQYRKTYLCICEGLQEKMYLEHVAKLMKRFPEKVITFHTFIDSPQRLLNRYEEYDSAAIFDYDLDDVKFKKNIEICDKLNKELKPSKRKSGRHIYHAYSNVNFDLWLILHKKECSGCVWKNDAYIQDVRKNYGLKSTDNIKNEEIINKILSQITLEDVKDAIKRAEQIRSGKVKADGWNIGNTLVFSNPDFSIDQFLKTVLEDSGDL